MLCSEKKVWNITEMHVTGPWLVGEIMEGHTGVIFAWGMFVHGSYLPVPLTYLYGVLQVKYCLLLPCVVMSLNVTCGVFVNQVLMGLT